MISVNSLILFLKSLQNRTGGGKADAWTRCWRHSLGWWRWRPQAAWRLRNYLLFQWMVHDESFIMVFWWKPFKLQMILIWLSIESHIFYKTGIVHGAKEILWFGPPLYVSGRQCSHQNTFFFWNHISPISHKSFVTSKPSSGRRIEKFCFWIWQYLNLQRFVKSIFLQRSHGPAKMRFAGLEIHQQRLDKVWDAWLSKTKRCVWKRWRWTMINKYCFTNLATFATSSRALEHMDDCLNCRTNVF